MSDENKLMVICSRTFCFDRRHSAQDDSPVVESAPRFLLRPLEAIAGTDM